MPSRNREHPPLKLPVDPRRIRSMPLQFGALDRNLVYRDHLSQMSSAAIALYTFLICVSDPQGLSYYSDRRLSQDLHLTTDELRRARQALVTRRFILYRQPIYQLLDLPPDGGQRADGSESSVIAPAKAPPSGPAPTRRSSPSPVCVPACAVPGTADRQRTDRPEAVPIGTVIRSLLGDQA